MKIRKNIIFRAGVEEGEHRAEEEDNRTHKDRAPGILTKSNLMKYEASYSGNKKNRIRTCHKREPISNAFREILILLFMTNDRK